MCGFYMMGVLKSLSSGVSDKDGFPDRLPRISAKGSLFRHPSLIDGMHRNSAVLDLRERLELVRPKNGDHESPECQRCDIERNKPEKQEQHAQYQRRRSHGGGVSTCQNPESKADRRR